ncbi:toxin-antitoxin system YwqK family antitoxin, partial [Fusobacterium massiliense]|uniref:toxin-antitoxin system YwqK family antitoxin n=1 Tax=Fusobacterium massiliense TaxID=1852365 RepID=UPI0036F3D101
MKKIKVLFAIIFILLFASCGKPREVNITDMEIREGIAYVKGETKAFTGIIKSYYDNGALKEDIPYKDGKKNGIGKVYYPNGNLESIGNYKDGKKEGLVKEYYENGALKWEG